VNIYAVISYTGNELGYCAILVLNVIVQRLITIVCTHWSEVNEQYMFTGNIILKPVSINTNTNPFNYKVKVHLQVYMLVKF